MESKILLMKGLYVMRLLCFSLLLLIVPCNFAITEDNNFPSPKPLDVSQFGSKIQGTMSLLATGTPDKRNKVRILFYGQIHHRTGLVERNCP